MAERNPEKDSNRRLLIVGLIIVLLTINGILFYMQHQKKQKVEEQEEIIRVKNTELEDQIKKFEALKLESERQAQELAAMGLTNDSLNARIEAINADLTQLRSFRKSSFSLADQRKFRDRANSLEKQLKEKDAEIAKLKEDNQVLFSENTNLKTTQNRLSDSLTTMKSTNQSLSQKVALASKLDAQNIKVTILNDKGKEKDDKDSEYKAKNVSKIKVSFRLGRNDVATKEPKEILMRLIEPDGATLYNLSTGSGSFEIEGEDMYYTAKKEIVFDNSQQQVSFTYDKGAEYKRGQHTIELYAEGFLIGKSTFTLK